LATIDDVAAKAGVSIKSVSRVVNNEPHVSQKIKDKVLAAVKELGYQPSQAARRMAGGRSRVIVALYSALWPAYVMKMCSGAGLECRRQGWHLVIEPISMDGSDYEKVISRVVQTLKPDGVFVAPPYCDDPIFLEVMEKYDLPLVRVAAARDGYGMRLEVDDVNPAFKMTEHLIKLGHKQIGFISADKTHLSAYRRLTGYQDALEAYDIKFDEGLVIEGKMDFQSGKEVGKEMLSGPKSLTAIFASTDDMALGVLVAARELGLSVPEDISICGFDDNPSSEKSWPPLTTMRQPVQTIGEIAVRSIINKQLPTDFVLPYELIDRASTASISED